MLIKHAQNVLLRCLMYRDIDFIATKVGRCLLSLAYEDVRSET